jgi:ATP-binding cassette subfamily F protein 3
MSLVAVLNVNLTVSGKELFREVTFQVEPGERIGLVGPNGAGKTTLLRLLHGEIAPDSGDIRTAKGTQIGYLPQDVHETLSGNLLQSLLDSVPLRRDLKQEMAGIERSLNVHSDQEVQARMAARLADIHQHLNDLDVQFPRHVAEKILAGLGFQPDDLDRPISSLSGGWKMRVALGSLLYRNPDLLLLDEPTNHLDFPSVRWLEEFLENFKGAIILVCHDRDFLNRQIHRTISFEPEGMRFYSGNYDFYVTVREEERRTLEAKARNQEQKVKEAQRFVERFKAKSSKARQAQSKIKLIKKIELIKTHERQKTIQFSFPRVTRSGRDVVTIEGICKSFSSRALYKNLRLRVIRGDRVAIIGPNGAGKTTLLRMVAGELAPDEGQIILGHGVTMSYYAQHHSEMLDPKKTILEEVYQAVPHESISFVRGICGAFLFSGADVDKAVGVLSGGEKARVSLAKILIKPGNLMIMDEPTNHLDIISSEILIDALDDYNGTLLFVSHNLSFVNRLATKVWDIRDRTIVDYPGTLIEYEHHLSLNNDSTPSRATPPTERDQKDVPRIPFQGSQSRKTARREKAERRSRIAAVLKPIQERLRALEQRIDDTEKRKAELEKELADPEVFKDKDRCVPLLNEYDGVRKKLDELIARWEYQHLELESAKKELGTGESHGD